MASNQNNFLRHVPHDLEANSVRDKLPKKEENAVRLTYEDILKEIANFSFPIYFQTNVHAKISSRGFNFIKERLEDAGYNVEMQSVNFVPTITISIPEKPTSNKKTKVENTQKSCPPPYAYEEEKFFE